MKHPVYIFVQNQPLELPGMRVNQGSIRAFTSIAITHYAMFSFTNRNVVVTVFRKKVLYANRSILLA
jgi:hypothetical protein